MNAYFNRCKQADYPELVELAKALGIVEDRADIETGQSNLVAVNGSDWYYIGQLWEGTGVFVDVGGIPTEQTQLIVDADGAPYIHVNVQTRFSLRDRAAELAAQSPELAAAMQNMGKYFILDADGQPRRPNAPQCVFSSEAV